MSAKTMTHSCRCGSFSVKVTRPKASSGSWVKCYCVDCQSFANHLSAADHVMDQAGGTDIYQTTPDHLEILAGAEHLKALRLSPKGTMRWYAGCCDTPMFNTAPNVRLPFVGMILAGNPETDAFCGPISGHVNTIGAKPGLGAPEKDQGFSRLLWRVFSRMGWAMITGRRATIFANAEGKPVGEVRVLTLKERNAAAEM